MTGQFLRRKTEVRHTCLVPGWRWLPWLIVPRWRDGARWQCGRWDDPPPSYLREYSNVGVPQQWVGGCGTTWIFKSEWADMCLRSQRNVWVDESTLPKGSLEPIFVIDPDTGERIPNSPPMPPA